MNMSKSRKLFPVIAVGLLAVAGCQFVSKDKHKLLTRGENYLAEGKLSEACLTFRQAIQADESFAEAHYRLAKCELKRGDLAPGYHEMLRTVELQPNNWAAQLDLAQL